MRSISRSRKSPRGSWQDSSRFCADMVCSPPRAAARRVQKTLAPKRVAEPALILVRGIMPAPSTFATHLREGLVRLCEGGVKPPHSKAGCARKCPNSRGGPCGRPARAQRPYESKQERTVIPQPAIFTGPKYRSSQSRISRITSCILAGACPDSYTTMRLSFFGAPQNSNKYLEQLSTGQSKS
jgi:hypothetical protein